MNKQQAKDRYNLSADFEPRYDLAATNDPRVIFIDSPYGLRRDVPRLGYVVLPNRRR